LRQPTATLTFTTIHDAEVLEAYHQNLKRFGHLDQVEVVVIPDRKTPRTVFERARSIRDRGLRVQCPTLEEQGVFLRSVGVPPELVPFDSDNRRNVGYLMALASGSDFVVSIDDDNYCTDEDDVFGQHAVVCAEAAEQTVTSSATGFFNICSLLEFDKPAPVYARGFPYFARHKDENPRLTRESVAVHMNAGLWTLDPDIDGITWLVALPHVKSFRGPSIVLARDTWSPVNTQNTALARHAIPAYYFIKMGYPIAGMPIDRYGDIFSGYFAQACVKHLGGAVRVGTPIAEHRRNSHDYLKDATNELACILLLEELLPWLRELRLSGDTFIDAYASLSHEIQAAVERFQGGLWTDATRGYFHQVAYYMRSWLRACRQILGS